jgi:hypothetical protein
MVPPGFSTSCICRSAATGSGQICIELIANALSKVSFANGRALDAAKLQLDPPTLNCGRVSRRGLFDHFVGAIML